MTKTIEDSAEKLYSIKEVADFLSISVQTVKKLIEKGRLKAIQITDKCIRVSPEDLSEFVKSNKSVM